MAHILEVIWIENQEQGLTIYGDVTVVFKCLEHIVEVGNVVFIAGILLLADHLVATFVLPCICFPVMVCPCKAEWKIWFAGIENLIEWAL